MFRSTQSKDVKIFILPSVSIFVCHRVSVGSSTRKNFHISWMMNSIWALNDRRHAQFMLCMSESSMSWSDEWTSYQNYLHKSLIFPMLTKFTHFAIILIWLNAKSHTHNRRETTLWRTNEQRTIDNGNYYCTFVFQSSARFCTFLIESLWYDEEMMRLWAERWTQ